MKICQRFGKEYQPRYYDHTSLYCSDCRKLAYKEKALVTQKQREQKEKWFAVEWRAWKRDFARGVTDSNV